MPPGDNLPPVKTRPGRQYAPRQYATQTICHQSQYATRDNMPPETICHQRQYATRDNMPPGQYATRTICHQSQYAAKGNLQPRQYTTWR